MEPAEEHGITVYQVKYECAITEPDWIRNWLTPTGFKNWSSMIQVIIALQRPQNIKQVWLFIGAVTYFHDMWPHKSHSLASLTNLTDNSLFCWNAIH